MEAIHQSPMATGKQHVRHQCFNGDHSTQWQWFLNVLTRGTVEWTKGQNCSQMIFFFLPSTGSVFLNLTKSTSKIFPDLDILNGHNGGRN